MLLEILIVKFKIAFEIVHVYIKYRKTIVY